MVLNDFGIKTEKDARDAARAVEKALEDGMDNCAWATRVRKSAERMVRFYARTLEISDLPQDKRERWVNKLMNKLA